MENKQRLTRSRDDRMLAGVAGGVGKYFDTDPTLVRLILVIAAFATDGLMIWIYILMAIIVPEEEKTKKVLRVDPEDNGPVPENERVVVIGEQSSGEVEPKKDTVDPAVWLGIGLILLGAFFLLSRLGLFWWFNWGIMWPLLIVLVGIWIILRSRR
ncbi:phage shock protein C [Methanolobus psychrophilus R15]|nr:phage shock protein C [Methanolobus psychrophilus R15]